MRHDRGDGSGPRAAVPHCPPTDGLAGTDRLWARHEVNPPAATSQYLPSRSGVSPTFLPDSLLGCPEWELPTAAAWTTLARYSEPVCGGSASHVSPERGHRPSSPCRALPVKEIEPAFALATSLGSPTASSGRPSNDPGGSRTRDLRIKSPLLYQLSYRVAACASTRLRNLIRDRPRYLRLRRCHGRQRAKDD